MGISALVLLLASAQEARDPARQFDFWIGEWSVQNRHMDAAGEWSDGDRTRARITPVCHGRAVLEEWAGPFRGSFMNGFSLRAWDPAREDWALLLFWTTDGDGAFGRLRGSFRHGRGEFFSSWRNEEGVEVDQRYTFSDALPETVRWDSAVSRDGGVHWRTDWIMEFTRTRPAAGVTEQELFDVAWTEGSLSPHPEARRLDWMIGSWEGVQTGVDGSTSEARLRCRLLNKDCLLLESLQTRARPDEAWHSELAVSGYVSRRGAWERWRLSESDPRIVRQLGTEGNGAEMRFQPAGGGGGRQAERSVQRREDGAMILRDHLPQADGSEPELLRELVLRRASASSRR